MTERKVGRGIDRRDLLRGAMALWAGAAVARVTRAQAAAPDVWAGEGTAANRLSLEVLAREILDQRNPYGPPASAPPDDRITFKYAAGNDWIRYVQSDRNGASWSFDRRGAAGPPHAIELSLRIPYFVSYAGGSDPQLEYLLVGYNRPRGTATAPSPATCADSHVELWTPCTPTAANDYQVLGDMLMRVMNPALAGAANRPNLVAVASPDGQGRPWRQQIREQNHLVTWEFRGRSFRTEKSLRIPYRVKDGATWRNADLFVGYEGSGGV